METKIIVRVNNVDIIATSDEQQLVPIRPICEALGIDYSRQLKKIKDDPDLGSVVGLKPTTGADGKTYEMCCLPLEYIFGWLFTISPSNVHEDAQEIVRKYRMECYHALFQHFTARARFVEQKQKEIDHQLTVVDEAKENFRNAKNVLSDAEAKLKKLRSLTMDDYDMERRQLKFNF